MAENTARHGIYLPHELLEWFETLSKNTKIKKNELMLDALKAYRDKHTATGKPKKDQFEKDVLAVLKKHGIS